MYKSPGSATSMKAWFCILTHQAMSSSHFGSSCLLAVLGFAFGVQAFWRMNCGVIQLGRVDPIINYGNISGHVHIIGGPNSQFVLSTVMCIS